MKNIYALFLMLLLGLTLSACGPNSDYYKAPTRTIYVYIGQNVEIDPYQVMKDNNSWLNLSDDVLNNLQTNYPTASADYKLKSNSTYKPIEVNNGVINVSQTVLKSGNSYDFKLHFIGKDQTEADQINFLVTYKLIKAESMQTDTISKLYNTNYSLLDNLTVLKADGTIMTSAEIASTYTTTYAVKFDDKNVTVNKGILTLNKEGAYTITVTLATSGGSQSFYYTINVTKDATQTTTTQTTQTTDGTTSASSENW